MFLQNHFAKAVADRLGNSETEFDVSWPALEPWSTEPLVIHETFYAFDGPLHFSVMIGPLFLVLIKISQLRNGNGLFVASVAGPELVSALRDNALSVRAATLAGARYVMELDGLTVARFWNVGPGNIPEKWLPTPGVCLSDYGNVAPDQAVFGMGDSAVFEMGLDGPGTKVMTAFGRGYSVSISAGAAGLWEFVSAFLPRWRRVRHKERGSFYDVVFEEASVQAKRPIMEGDVVAVYVGDDGRPWVRLVSEFNDGRFDAA